MGEMATFITGFIAIFLILMVVLVILSACIKIVPQAQVLVVDDNSKP